MIPPAPWPGTFPHADTSALTGLPLANPVQNRFREKRWCYAGIVSPRLFFGMAVVHLGYITSAFAFGFDRETGRIAEQTIICPPLGLTRFDRHPENGTCAFKALGQRIEIRNEGPSKRLRVSLGKQAIRADLTFSVPETGFAAMHLPMRTTGGKAAFTTKAAGLAVSGSVTLNGTPFSLSPGTAFGLFDWTHGSYHRKTHWNWACGAGAATDETGTPATLGFNFSRGVYAEDLPENFLWIDGRPEPCGSIRFEYDPHDPAAPWRIASEDGRIAVTFHPEGARQASDNFGLVASRFIQPCGRFQGRITVTDGRTLTLTDMGGVTEEHYAKW